MYLPSEMSGTVTFVGKIENGGCVVGTGAATVAGVQSGETSAARDSLDHRADRPVHGR